MYGTFSEDSLKTCEQLLKTGTFDFTRCVRPNGTAYGTSGTCRKGVPQENWETGTSSGGRISGKAFDSGRTFFFEDTSRSLEKALKNSKGPLNKRKKAEALLNASEDYVKALKQIRDKRGADEALSAISRTSHLPLQAWDKFAFEGYSRVLGDQSQRLSDLKSKLSRLGESRGRDYDVLKFLD